MTPEQEKGSDGTRDTIKVEADNDDGYAVINASDFDKSKHTLFVEESQEDAEKKDPKDMTQKELSAHLTLLNVEHDSKAKKADLLALVPASK